MAERLRGTYKFANEEDDVSVVSSYIMLALGFESGDVAAAPKSQVRNSRIVSPVSAVRNETVGVDRIRSFSTDRCPSCP